MAKWLFGRKTEINLCYIKAFFYQFLSPISGHAFGFFVENNYGVIVFGPNKSLHVHKNIKKS